MVGGKKCRALFDSKQKLKEHLSPAPLQHCESFAFCCEKNSFNRTGNLKSNFGERHKDAVLARNVPMNELHSENNYIWLSYNPAYYRYLVVSTDRNARATSRLRSRLLKWTRKINAIPAGPKVKKRRHDLTEESDKPVTDFRVPDVPVSTAPTEHIPTFLDLFTLMSVRLSSDDVSAILDDNTSFYRVLLNNTVLFDA